MQHRTENDSFGEIAIPTDKCYGASTQRAVDNFPVSRRRFEREFIAALGFLKKAAAGANSKLGRLDEKLAAAIEQAAEEVARGKYDSHFPVDIFQTGSGTSTNMNANEVIANLSNLSLGEELGTKSPVHPNDHVNQGQSSNDVIPSSIHIAAARQIMGHLKPAMQELATSLEAKAKEFAGTIKIGRTHLQDATPVTLGQEFSAYAQQILHGMRRVDGVFEELCELAIGGTAVGTGINTHPDFAKTVCALLEKETKIRFREAVNHFEAQGAKDAIVSASGALKSVAVSLLKIANDIRWLSSGPRCGIGEIILPELQPGSSIMPGKVNPVIPEAVMQVAAQVMGNDTAIMIGGQHGNFELNVMMPMMASNLLESIYILSNACLILTSKCVDGIIANEERAVELVEQSLALVTKLVPEIGYDEAARLAKRAYKERKTIREILIADEILPKDALDSVLDPKSMLSPE
jgi:fumarate hydratase, class II